MQSPTFVAESASYFTSLRLRASDSVMPHYMPDTRVALAATGEAWRPRVERSESFLACFLELLCRRGGICLELGCGTAPILKACLCSGRVCVSLDLDETLVTAYI